MSATLIRFPDGRQHFASSGSSNDPIFAVIEDRKAAVEAYNSAVDLTSDMLPTGPEYWAARAVIDTASDRLTEVNLLILTTQPTSLLGVAALLQHVGLPEYLEEGDETLLSTYIHENANDKRKQAALTFPTRCAETIRNLVGAQTPTVA
jgi:hypothetical protein